MHPTIHKSEIAIVDPNSLVCMGLKQLLQTMMPTLTVRSFLSFGELIDDTPDMYAHYFISAQIYIEHTAFFLPRKQKVVVLTVGDAGQFQLAGLLTLNTAVPEELLVKNLLKLYGQGHQPPCAKKVTEDTSQSMNGGLSVREGEVLTLLAKGYINKEIAERLNISQTTVITHRKNIVEKLGIRSVSGLTIYAVMNGFVEADSI